MLLKKNNKYLIQFLSEKTFKGTGVNLTLQFIFDGWVLAVSFILNFL